MRVAEILFLEDNGPLTLILDGRLQWVTPIQPASPLGFSKPSMLDDATATEVINRLRYEPAWASEVEVPGKLGDAYQLVWDEDGRYFTIPDPIRALALVARRR